MDISPSAWWLVLRRGFVHASSQASAWLFLVEPAARQPSFAFCFGGDQEAKRPGAHFSVCFLRVSEGHAHHGCTAWGHTG